MSDGGWIQETAAVLSCTIFKPFKACGFKFGSFTLEGKITFKAAKKLVTLRAAAHSSDDGLNQWVNKGFYRHYLKLVLSLQIF